MPEPISTTLIAAGVSGIVSSLFGRFADRMAPADKVKVTRLKTNISPVLESTFKKCSNIKTLLNPQRPAELMNIYATQRFVMRGDELDHYSLVEYIKNECCNVVLTRSGGSGKSIFTRYLWMALCVDDGGRIPLFIELRNLNSLTTDSVFAFIYHSINAGIASIDESEFKWYLSRGDFVLLLDGFDEVAIDKKASIQRQIIEISDTYPKLKIIVTSRPEGNFASWPSFEVAQMAPMTKDDVVELVNKAEFDEEIKNRFVRRINSAGGLYEKHKSFLENPLLASMMLLTFSHNFDIPDRMHLFYDQAFDALYQRHDSYKPGGYKREFKTNITEDVFRRVLAYFCMITYHEEEFYFSRDRVISVLRKAINIESPSSSVSSAITPDDFFHDLVSSVCFLVSDGLEYTFSHRSFQEYFCACGVSCLKPEMIPNLIMVFLRRHSDVVVRMLSDMQPDLFRRAYVLPMAERFKPDLETAKPLDVVRFLEVTGWEFHVQKFNRQAGSGLSAMYAVYFDGGGDFGNFVGVAQRGFRDKSGRIRKTRNESLRDGDRKLFDKIYDVIGKEGRVILGVRSERGRIVCTWNSSNGKSGVETGEIDFDQELMDAFSATSMYAYISESAKRVVEFVAANKREEKKMSAAITDIFGITI